MASTKSSLFCPISLNFLSDAALGVGGGRRGGVVSVRMFKPTAGFTSAFCSMLTPSINDLSSS